MLVEKLSIEGFKCFKNKTEIKFDKFNGFIGNNGTGKTAILEALVRLFGSNLNDRKIKNQDFFIPLGEALEDKGERKLSIEVTLTFPELANDSDSSSVPEFFNQMIVEEVGGDPYCRIRLEAVWKDSNIPGGEIEEKIFWVTSQDENKGNRPLTITERSKIRVHYIPALREPQKQMKQTAGTILYQLLKNVDWSEALTEKLKEVNKEISAKFREEAGIRTVNNKFSDSWNSLFNDKRYEEVNISMMKRDFKNILSNIEATFSSASSDLEDNHEKLSDGMKSLFYFTLIITLFKIEETIIDDREFHGFNADSIKFPYLNIFAIEEPENHLAPHYFGKVMSKFREIISTGRAQVVLTSHSPAILKRIEPEEIRYLLQNIERISEVKELILPESRSEAYKYVKEAIKAYPELYFSRLVILGEGDSEEIVLPKLLRAHGIDLDSSFASIVPLGGRHVNHFWKLLNQLNIPFFTILDYDRGRDGGGFGRIKYVIKQLIENRIPKEKLLMTDNGVLSDNDLEKMHSWGENINEEKFWIEKLKEYNVYFSYEIDIDFSMFRQFSEAYKKLESGQKGPQISNDEESVKKAVASVLKKEAQDINDIEKYRINDSFEIWFWYRYLFLGKGKPSTHINALLWVDEEEMFRNAPDELKIMAEKIRRIIESDIR